MFVPHVGHAADHPVPLEVSVAATEDEEHVKLVVDDSDATAWCQKNGRGTLFVDLSRGRVAHARVVLHYSGAKKVLMVVQKAAKEIEIDHPSPVSIEVEGHIDWVGITLEQNEGEIACVSEVQIYELKGPAAESKVEPKAQPSKKPVTLAKSTTKDIVTNDALARAPDEIRALRLGLEDCDLATMKAWVIYPLHADGTIYESAAAQRKACLHGDALAVAPTAADLDAALANMSASGDLLTLSIGDRTWRLRWRKGQWWLTGVE
jgi:hypothetical protein